MDQGLKERLVGAVVLVALGVLVIPWVLDGGRDEGATSTNALRLPAPDEPLAVRSETIRVGDQVEQSSAQAEVAAPSVVVAAAGAEPGAATAEAVLAAAAVEAAPPPATTPPAANGGEAVQQTSGAAPSRAPAASAARQAGGWLVQLGSFGDEENARRLAQRVGTYGYKPEISNHRAGGRVMYRVRLGAYASRAQADATASSLAVHGFVAQVVAAD